MHIHQVNGKRRHPKKEPQPHPPPVDLPQVSQAQNANLQPLLLRVLGVHLLSRRRTQTLHAEITRTQQQRSQKVDQNVQPKTCLLNFPTRPNMKCPDPIAHGQRDARPHCNRRIGE